MMKKVKIVSDGVQGNTDIMYGDEKLSLVQRAEFVIDVDDPRAKLNLYFAMGHLELSPQGKETVEIMIADGYSVQDMADVVNQNRDLEKTIKGLKQKVDNLGKQLSEIVYEIGGDGIPQLISKPENPDIKTEE